MIDGRIQTAEQPDGSIIYRGHVRVTGETLTAGVVASGHIPEGPRKGFERVTRRWVCSPCEPDGDISGNSTYCSSCSFEVTDIRQVKRDES